MEVYLVGGAVRDSLLGLAVSERDWVVVGATADDLLREGYTQVGREFPVFLHPETHEEYALARTERKVSPGHTGFVFDTSAGVTLEQDLARRDLTINAMAKDAAGRIIDPWGGRRDLDRRVLRHVSDAFGEDPLRVLRAARFAAELGELGFTVADETLELMTAMAAGGELESLQPDRVWQETGKALGAPRPDVYFETLRRVGALAVVFPEVDRLFGVPQPERWHPEIDTGVHVLMTLRMAARLSEKPEIRFALLTHDLGKGTTPAEMLPSHHGHAERSVELLEQMAGRLPVPRRFLSLATLVARHHGNVHRADELRPGTVLELIMDLDGLRRPERFDDFLVACEADARGRKGFEDSSYPQADRLRRALGAARSVGRDNVDAKDLSGPALGAALREERLRAITRCLAEPEAAPGAR